MSHVRFSAEAEAEEKTKNQLYVLNCMRVKLQLAEKTMQLKECADRLLSEFSEMPKVVSSKHTDAFHLALTAYNTYKSFEKSTERLRKNLESF